MYNNGNDDSNDKEGCRDKEEINMMNNANMLEKNNNKSNIKPSKKDVLRAIKKSHKKHKETMSLLAK